MRCIPEARSFGPASISEIIGTGIMETSHIQLHCFLWAMPNFAFIYICSSILIAPVVSTLIAAILIGIMDKNQGF